MKRLSIRHAFAALMVVTAIGCQKEAGDTKATTAAAATAKPTPEESFETIVETFRRGVEDVPFGFKVDDGSGGRTMMTGRNVVTHKLIPPAKEGDALKAEIKVASQSEYSLQRSTEQPESDSTDESADAPDTASADGSDVQIFDPSVASAPGSGADRRTTTTKADKNAVTVARRDNKDERTYELVYENGRWKLITELDPKTEELIKFAFDRALATQS